MKSIGIAIPRQLLEDAYNFYRQRGKADLLLANYFLVMLCAFEWISAPAYIVGLCAFLAAPAFIFGTYSGLFARERARRLVTRIVQENWATLQKTAIHVESIEELADATKYKDCDFLTIQRED